MLFKAKVTRVERITDEVFLLAFQRPEKFHANPGQFLQLKIAHESYPLLRRPISIYSQTDSEVLLLIKKVGLLTERFSELKVQDEVDILGPLGSSFEVKEENKNIIVLGGGIGVAPIAFFAEELKRHEINFESYLGFKDQAYALESFEGAPLTIHVERKKPGFIIEELEERLELNSDAIIYACGPTLMLKAVKRLANKFSCECYLSLEERMACGLGACLGCAVKIRRDSEVIFKKVCKDGPVFLAEEVMWDEFITG